MPQDVAVNKNAPQAKTSGKISKSEAQHKELQQVIQNAQNNRARDIRVNQHQVNAAGERVGIKRPDLQYTDRYGQRIYIEYDTPPGTRAADHYNRIISNDPAGKVILKEIP